jgi:hypothetical protein
MAFALSVSVAPKNQTFAMDRSFLIDVRRCRLIRAFGSSNHITIPAYLRFLGSHCFSGWTWIHSLSFEANSQLKGIEIEAFGYAGLRDISIPSTICFIASSAFLIDCAVSLTAGDPPNGFSDWRLAREIQRQKVNQDRRLDAPDFKRLDPTITLSDCVIDLSQFESCEFRDQNDFSHHYRRLSDGVEIVVKRVSDSCFEGDPAQLIERQLNLKHNCVCRPFG